MSPDKIAATLKPCRVCGNQPLVFKYKGEYSIGTRREKKTLYIVRCCNIYCGFETGPYDDDNLDELREFWNDGLTPYSKPRNNDTD